MKTQQLKKFRRPVLVVFIAIALGQNMAYADLSVGSIFGQAQAGAVVNVVNVDTGLKRSLTTDGNGRFSFSQLPSGRYKVTSNGIDREVQVALGTGTSVNFNADATEHISVVGSAINPIDTSSVESSTVLTATQLEMLPVGRDISDVALLAPGTVRGDSGFGNWHPLVVRQLRKTAITSMVLTSPMPAPFCPMAACLLTPSVSNKSKPVVLAQSMAAH